MRLQRHNRHQSSPAALRLPRCVEAQLCGEATCSPSGWQLSSSSLPSQVPDARVNKLSDSLSPAIKSLPSQPSSLPRWGPGYHGAKTSPSRCSLLEFITHRISEHNKSMVVYATKFGVVFYSPVVTKTMRHILSWLTSMDQIPRLAISFHPLLTPWWHPGLRNSQKQKTF